MSAALAMAIRVQDTIDTLAACKDRPDPETEAEQRLQGRMTDVLAPLIDRIHGALVRRGRPPSDRGDAALMIGDLADLEDDLAGVLADELLPAAAEAIAAVEQAVATQAPAALKRTTTLAAWAADAHRRRDMRRHAQMVDEFVRPYGMDRKLFDQIYRMGGRVLQKFTGRTLDALVSAADVDLPADELRRVLGEMLDGELSQLSRHAFGDIRNEATETAERALGVTHHRWVTAGDDLVRPAHADVDGEVAEIGETFSNGWRRPGGVGCRCRLEPVVNPQ